MGEMTLIDHLALKLDIPQAELRNPVNLEDILKELLIIPAGLYPLREWDDTISCLYRGHYCFSSIERAKAFAQAEINKNIDDLGWRCKVLRLIKAWLAPAICGVAVFLLMQYVFMFCFVPSASMEPTIRAGSFIFASRIYGELEVGDIIVFEKDGKLLVKRIVAVPEDTVYINDKTGGYSLAPMDDSTKTLIVPTGCFFVVGDNEGNSLDSRFWEDPYIHKSMIRARLL